MPASSVSARAARRPASPYTYVTTEGLPVGLQPLRDLPDVEALEDTGLLSRTAVASESAVPAADDNEP